MDVPLPEDAEFVERVRAEIAEADRGARELAPEPRPKVEPVPPPAPPPAPPPLPRQLVQPRAYSTPEERERRRWLVLFGMGRGRTPREIAERHDIEVQTVYNDTFWWRAQLGLDSLEEFIEAAREHVEVIEQQVA